MEGNHDHLDNTFDVVVGWNPDALTWVANTTYSGKSMTGEGATPDRALAALVGKVEQERERNGRAGVER